MVMQAIMAVLVGSNQVVVGVGVTVRVGVGVADVDNNSFGI
jgi:hypothetical protein